MALDSTKLSPASNQQNDSLPRPLVYTTSDNKAAVAAANYWAGSRARTGDWVMCKCSDGGVLLFMVSVSASASTVTALTPA